MSVFRIVSVFRVMSVCGVISVCGVMSVCFVMSVCGVMSVCSVMSLLGIGFNLAWVFGVMCYVWSQVLRLVPCVVFSVMSLDVTCLLSP